MDGAQRVGGRTDLCLPAASERDGRVSHVRLLKILFAILFPPISVLLETGLSRHFLLNVLLTILGVIPGSIHAVWVLIRRAEGGLS